ncbi:MAG TPA: Asd/ArgC dimerization domain-containing protein [Bryobacteraceae bacterium]|nr:Asd/ArgC dimerization domain-containing protein [Bryobacteraceae bacterium]
MAKSNVLALVGSESLIGREIRDLLSGNPLGEKLKLIAAGEDEVGKLTHQGGEAAIVAALETQNLGPAGIIFLAGPPESTRRAMEVAPDARLIDLTGANDDSPRARLRAPMVELAGYSVPADSIHVIPNAAAIAIALVMGRLHDAHKIKRAVAHIFEPASERGAAGVEELQAQTIGLLSFKGQPKEIFDAQLAFNLLAGYGEEAPMALADAEVRVERHLATLLSMSSQAPMPSLRLVQAPVFHGYSVSLWIEFESNPEVSAIEKALDRPPVDVRRLENGLPDVVGMAGQEGLAVGGIAPDRNQPQAAWLWIVADNLRLQAQNALAVARELTGARAG